MKTFIAAFAHETNSFSPIATTRQSYERSILYHPRRNPDQDPADAFVGYSDFVRIARHRGHEFVAGLVAWAQPSAPTNQADYEALRDEILHDLEEAMPVDTVLLMLHGAQMAVGYDDCEGDLLRRVREIVGHDIPVGVELDLHCNISDAMVEHATVIIACKEYPHTDFDARAVELYDVIERTAEGRCNPVMVLQRIPMLSKFHTTDEPMRSFVDKVCELETGPKVLSVTLAHGFAWSDTSDTGSSVLVVTDDDKQLGRCIADSLASEFFALRAEVNKKYHGVEEALDAALASRGDGPAVVADISDNAGGGAAGDSTFVLAAMLERRIENAALAMIWDPDAVCAAGEAGVGATLPLSIGGKHGKWSGEALLVDATVLAVADSPSQQGLDPHCTDPLGPSVAIRLGGVDVVINSRRQQVFSPDCFTAVGIDPAAKDVLVVKSSQHFHAQFAPLARAIIYCDAPGALSSDMSAVSYSKLQRPIWPLDDVNFDSTLRHGQTRSS